MSYAHPSRGKQESDAKCRGERPAASAQLAAISMRQNGPVSKISSVRDHDILLDRCIGTAIMLLSTPDIWGFDGGF